MLGLESVMERELNAIDRMTLMRQNYKYVGKKIHKKEITFILSAIKIMQKTVVLINASLINNFLLLIFLALLP